jgi:hypothetical protein
MPHLEEPWGLERAIRYLNLPIVPSALPRNCHFSQKAGYWEDNPSFYFSLHWQIEQSGLMVLGWPDL